MPPIGLPIPPSPLVPAAGVKPAIPAALPSIPAGPAGPMTPVMPAVEPNPIQVVQKPAVPAVPALTPLTLPANPVVVAAAPMPTPVVPAIPAVSMPDPVAVAPVPAMTVPEAPTLPDAVAVAPVPAPTVPAAPVVPSPEPAAVAAVSPAGKMMLDQAKQELKHGDLEMATKMATLAHNADAGSKAEAQDVLREIDAAKGTRRRAAAAQAFKNAVESANVKQYEQALGVFKLLDTDSLPPDQKRQYPELMAKWTDEAAKQAAPHPAAGHDIAAAKPAAGLTEQVKALNEVEFQKLRSEGLDAETKARAAFDRGETDLAIQMLTDYVAKVKASSLSAGKQNLLLGHGQPPGGHVRPAQAADGLRSPKQAVRQAVRQGADRRPVAGRAAAERGEGEEGPRGQRPRQEAGLPGGRGARPPVEDARPGRPGDRGLVRTRQAAPRRRRGPEAQGVQVRAVPGRPQRCRAAGAVC